MKNNYTTHDKNNCKWCDATLDVINLKFLVKNKMRSHTSCTACGMPLVVQKSALGYIALYKSSYSRFKKNYERGVNRLKFKL